MKRACGTVKAAKWVGSVLPDAMATTRARRLLIDEVDEGDLDLAVLFEPAAGLESGDTSQDAAEPELRRPRMFACSRARMRFAVISLVFGLRDAPMLLTTNALVTPVALPTWQCTPLRKHPFPVAAEHSSSMIGLYTTPTAGFLSTHKPIETVTSG